MTPEESTARYLAAVDQVLPGFVDMLFLTGSVALGAFQPGVSDIDTVIVTSRSPGRYGRSVRGPAVAELGLTVDVDELRQQTLDNLKRYWAREIRQALHGVPDDVAADATTVDAEAIVWRVLGPARLHYTLAHGDVITKAGAAAYLAKHFPAYASLADRAVRWRRGEPIKLGSCPTWT